MYIHICVYKFSFIPFVSIHESYTPLYFIRPSMLRKYLKNESIGRWLFDWLFSATIHTFPSFNSST